MSSERARLRELGRSAYLSVLLDGADRPEAFEFAAGPCPYRGLNWFEADNGPLLFARDFEAGKVLERFGGTRTVVVVGGSGSGKSSLVRGTVLPRLRRHNPVPGRSGPWYSFTMRPEREPVDRLVDALWSSLFKAVHEGDFGGSDARRSRFGELRKDLFGDAGSGDPRGRLRDLISAPAELEGQEPSGGGALHPGFERTWKLVDRLDAMGKGEQRDREANLLVVVDQFEEIFRRGVDPVQRRLFISMIREVQSRPRDGLFLALVMRAEDLHRCAEEPDLTELVNSSVFLLDWLKPEDVQNVIVKPARLVLEEWGLSFDETDASAPFEAAVVDALARDVGRLRNELEHKTDHLPLLQHGLRVLWLTAAKRWQSQLEAGREPDFRVTQEDFDLAMPRPALGVAGDPGRTRLGHCLDRQAAATLDKAAQAFADSYGGTPPLDGRSAILTAFCEFASLDENRRYYREFRTVREIVKHRFPFDEEADRAAAENALRAALETFAADNYLTKGRSAETDTYDVTHESLIRNWTVLREATEAENKIAELLRKISRRDGEVIVHEDELPLLKRLDSAPGGAGSAILPLTPTWVETVCAWDEGESVSPAGPVAVPAEGAPAGGGGDPVTRPLYEKVTRGRAGAIRRQEEALEAERVTRDAAREVERNRKRIRAVASVATALASLLVVAVVSLYLSHLNAKEANRTAVLMKAHASSINQLDERISSGLAPEDRARELLVAHLFHRQFDGELMSENGAALFEVGSLGKVSLLAERALDLASRSVLGQEAHLQLPEDFGPLPEPLPKATCEKIGRTTPDFSGSQSLWQKPVHGTDGRLEVTVERSGPAVQGRAPGQDLYLLQILLANADGTWAPTAFQIPISPDARICWDPDGSVVVIRGPGTVIPEIHFLQWYAREAPDGAQGRWQVHRKAVQFRGGLVFDKHGIPSYEEVFVLRDERTGRAGVVFGTGEARRVISFVDGLSTPMLVSDPETKKDLNPTTRLACVPEPVPGPNGLVDLTTCGLKDGWKLVAAPGPGQDGSAAANAGVTGRGGTLYLEKDDGMQGKISLSHIELFATQVDLFWEIDGSPFIFMKDKAGNTWAVYKSAARSAVFKDVLKSINDGIDRDKKETGNEGWSQTCELLDCSDTLELLDG